MDQEQKHPNPAEQAGGYGSPTPEEEMGPAGEAGNDTTESGVPDDIVGGHDQNGAMVPSVEAEMDETNTDSLEGGRPPRYKEDEV